MKHEIKALTGLRGIAAFYVMIYHYMKGYFISYYENGQNFFVGLLKNIVIQGYLAVDLFFMLSAFVLCLRYNDTFQNKIQTQDYKNFMRKRFNRIYPVYFISIIAIIIIFREFKVYHFIIESLFLQAYTDVMFDNHNVSTWSLSIEWTIYLIFPFLIYIFRKMGIIIHILCVLLALIILYFIQYLPKPVIDLRHFVLKFRESNETLNVHLGILALMRGMIAYYFGYLVYNYHKYIQSKILFVLSIFSLALILIFDLNDVLFFIPAIIFFASLIKENLVSKILKYKPIHYLGEISYSLYLFHFIILNAMREYSDFIIFKKDSFNFYMMAIACSLLFAAFSYEFFEKKLSKLVIIKS